MGLLFGFPGIEPTAGKVEDWSRRPVTLPEGWRKIEVDRLWVHDKPMTLTARHGEFATLVPR
jgi:hypothetical protein